MKRFLCFALVYLAGCNSSPYYPEIDPTQQSACDRAVALAWPHLPVALEDEDPTHLLATLDEWELACGLQGPVLRAGIIGRVRRGDFDEALFGDGDLAQLYDDATHSEWARRNPSDSPWRWTYRRNPSTDPVLIALRAAAQRDLARAQPESVEWLYLMAAAGEGEALTRQLESGRYLHTKLGRWYRDEVGPVEDLLVGTTAIALGLWNPQGSLAQLGDHPALGLNLGLSSTGWEWRFGAEFRYGSAANDYQVIYDGEEITTDEFGAFLLTFTLGRRIFRTHGWAALLLAGGGLHGLQLRPPGADGEDVEVSRRWQFDTGLELRRRISRQNFLFAEARHAWHDLDPPGSSDLSGSSWAFRIGFGRNGFVSDRWRRTDLLGDPPPLAP